MKPTAIESVKLGLALVLLGLAFGIGLGVAFGIGEDSFKNYIAAGIAANPAVHDSNSAGKIWRYALRAHFHAAGIGAFSLGLILLAALCNMTAGFKKASSCLIGLGSLLYPFVWFTMFLLAPKIGIESAHQHILTKACAYTSIGSLSAGLLILAAHLFLGLFTEAQNA